MQNSKIGALAKEIFANLSTAASCVSSCVMRSGMITLDVKSSQSTERAFSFCVEDKDNQPVFCADSRLICNHMNPRAGMGQQTTVLQHVEQTIRKVGRTLFHRINYLRYSAPIGLLFEKISII